MADQEREATPGAQERIELLSNQLVVTGWSVGWVLDVQVNGEHAAFQPIVDAFAVHWIDEAGGVADRDPTGTVAFLRRHWQTPGAGPFEVGAEVPFGHHLVAVVLEHFVEVQLLEPLHG